MSWYDPTSWDIGDVADAFATVATGGGYLIGKKVVGALAKAPDTVNSRGDVLTDDMKKQLDSIANPSARAEAMTNWLTAGGPPTPVDPAMLFTEAQGMGGVNAKAAAGQGVAGLFGFGKSIGEMGAASPRPFQAGVAYSAKPAPKVPSLNPILRPGGPGVVARSG